MEPSPACRPHHKCKGERELKIPSPRGGPHASRKRFPLSAPRTAPAGRAHALLARGLPLLIALAALAARVQTKVLASFGYLPSGTGEPWSRDNGPTKSRPGCPFL